jgi:hypothetical protein
MVLWGTMEMYACRLRHGVQHQRALAAAGGYRGMMVVLEVLAHMKMLNLIICDIMNDIA